VLTAAFFQVLYLDPKENPGAMEFFSVKAEDCPLIVVHSPEDGAKYSSGQVSVAGIASWVAKFKAGEVERIIKSEEIPEPNDEPVTVVVAKAFNDVVKSGKNVFIEFYAPWYVHAAYYVPHHPWYSN
jgi:protein disulfide-isomerase A1